MLKLQSKLNEARARKERAAAIAAGILAPEEQETSASTSPQLQVEELLHSGPPDVTLSGLKVQVLFPSAAAVPTAELTRSSFGAAMCTHAGQQGKAFVGSSPFDAVAASDERLLPFAQPSPEDVVLKAREGTRLAVQG